MHTLHTFWNSLDTSLKWLFGTMGVALVAEATRRIFFKTRPSKEIKQSQKLGDNSTGIQIGSIERAKDD
jgi:hypothetical protein